MFFVECRKCHGNCDRGELKDGICPECAEKSERQKKIVLKRMGMERYGRKNINNSVPL